MRKYITDGARNEDRLNRIEAKLDLLFEFLGLEYSWSQCLNPGCCEGYYQDGGECPECEGRGGKYVVARDETYIEEALTADLEFGIKHKVRRR